MKNHAADPEIGFLTKSISKPYVRAIAMPTAWDLRQFGSQKFRKIDQGSRILTTRNCPDLTTNVSGLIKMG